MWKKKTIYRRWAFIFFTRPGYRGWYLIPTINVSWIFHKGKYSYEYQFSVLFHFLFLTAIIAKHSQ